MDVLHSGSNNIEKANFPEHTHRYCEIIYSRSELVHFTVDGKSYDLTPGYVTVVPPGCVHSQYSDCPFIDLNLNAMNADFNVPVIVFDEDGEVLRLMEVIRGIAEKREHNFQLTIEYLYQAIILIIKRLEDRGHIKNFTSSFRNLLIGNISNEAFDVTAEIENTGYNPNYFRRAFCKDFGQTPLEYLTWLRITNAKQLLTLDSFKSVSEIAAQCGFSDSLYFSTCFKKHVGRSPLQYRKFILSHKGNPRKNG